MGSGPDDGRRGRRTDKAPILPMRAEGGFRRKRVDETLGGVEMLLVDVPPNGRGAARIQQVGDGTKKQTAARLREGDPVGGGLRQAHAEAAALQAMVGAAGHAEGFVVDGGKDA